MSRSQRLLSYYQLFSRAGHALFNKKNLKLKVEYLYWWNKKRLEKKLTHTHYHHFFTDYFELNDDWYAGKTILDIGCGPRGSLEWATQSKAYGLDPLSDQYKKLGTENHNMTYVQASCEDIPFEAGYFDVVSSFNSLDHVDDLDQCIKEIKRVTKKGGIFLLISDIHEHPTLSEPSPFTWDITEKFQPDFRVVKQNHYEGSKLYKSIRAGVSYDHSNKETRYGVITALLERQ